MTVLAPRRLFTVTEYYQMADARIINEDDRVELIEGEIIQMPGIGRKHASCVNRLNAYFSQLMQKSVVIIQNPLRLSEYSEPMPDVTLAKKREDFYSSAHPTAEDVHLIVEVSDSTYLHDRRIKVPLYAREGVAEVWVIDLNRNTVEVFRNPAPQGYQETFTLNLHQEIAPQAFPECKIPVSEIIPPL